MKSSVRFVPILGLVLLACPQQQVGTVFDGASLETEAKKTAYALGYGVGRNLVPLQLSEDELSALVLGISDSVRETKPRLDLVAYNTRVQALAQERTAAAATEEMNKSKAFLDEMAAKEGATRSASGLIYIEDKAGEGDSPAATDTVTVHYHGTLRDGTVFDSSRDRGAPATFPLNGVIPCWTEALQKMKPGGKATIVCPPEIAYGATGAPPVIPPGATLVFDVELLSVK